MSRSAVRRARIRKMERGIRNDDRELTGRLRDESRVDDERERPDARPDDGRRDVGRTSGGGSLGHKQPQDVAEETNIRNQPSDQRPPAGGDRS